MPHHAIAIPNEKPRTVFVASDAGVFVSTNAGGSWNDLTRNLPNVQIVDLVYHDRDQTLLAASYGRGLWRIKFKVSDAATAALLKPVGALFQVLARLRLRRFVLYLFGSISAARHGAPLRFPRWGFAHRALSEALSQLSRRCTG